MLPGRLPDADVSGNMPLTEFKLQRPLTLLTRDLGHEDTTHLGVQACYVKSTSS